MFSMMLFLLIFSTFESLKHSRTSVPLQCLHAQIGAISSELSCSFDLQGNSSFFFSPSDGEFGCYHGYPSLKKPLADSFRVFNNPVKIPQWILLQITELKEFSSCAHLHTVSMPSWQSIFSQNFQQFYTLLCTYAPTQCPLGRALTLLSDSGSP
jgi:hypothetical protein